MADTKIYLAQLPNKLLSAAGRKIFLVQLAAKFTFTAGSKAFCRVRQRQKLLGCKSSGAFKFSAANYLGLAQAAANHFRLSAGKGHFGFAGRQ